MLGQVYIIAIEDDTTQCSTGHNYDYQFAANSSAIEEHKIHCK